MFKKPWGGRFAKKPHKTAEKFSASIDFDKRLYLEDIEGSIAHARMLGETKIIPKKEATAIVKGLKSIEKEIESGSFPFREQFEDIHLNIEKRLIEKIGDIGGKLHTARSRNDQIALDERLYLRRQSTAILAMIKSLAAEFVSLAERHSDVALPLYTHIQRGQPVILAHHLLAYFEMLRRDRERFTDCLRRINVMPLGAGAGAGTSFPIDRGYVARALGFPEVTKNSIDTVSDRDFIIEFISVSSILMSHISRLAEELVLWSTREFDFVDLGDEFTTGSSIMPQKRNPDIAELLRGKCAKVYGNLISILTLMKGLPLSYNRDMQDDKEPMFSTADIVKSSLEVLVEMMKHITFKPDGMSKALSGGFITATDVADYLARKGMPFREAHEVAGKIVRYAEGGRRELAELNLSELRRFSELLEEDVFNFITVDGSISSRKSYGGTAGECVLKMIEESKKEVAAW
ncbi:MAG: argininosuccinate lyase [Deltaproteobacteria bacterium]